MFGLISGLTFVTLTGIMFYVYGWEFLDEAYLYHLIRKDNRHNFSVYFYYMYLTSLENSQTVLSTFIGLLAFIPQLIVLGTLTHKLYKDIAMCMCLQTITFVAFNKVCTVQVRREIILNPLFRIFSN